MRILFLIFMAAYIGGNIYVFVRLLQLLAGCSLGLKVVCASIFWIVALAMVFALLARGVGMPDVVMKSLYFIGSIWMVFTLYMVPALLLMDLSRFVGLSIRNGVLWVAVGVVCLLIYGYWNYRNPRVEHIEIEVEKNLSQDLTIVAVSDVHLGDGTGRRSLRRYVEMINAENPDVIIIGGDLIDNSLLPVLRNNMADELCRLEAPMGIYMALGNHEYISGIEGVISFLDTTPITLLRDRVATLPCGLQIVGRDDVSNRRRLPLSDLIARCDKAQPILVIDHQPYKLAAADSLGVDMQFSGHTHHGQVWPVSLLTDKMFEQSHGYRKWSNAHIYVSSGLSLWGPPFRIGTQCDMAVLHIRSIAP